MNACGLFISWFEKDFWKCAEMSGTLMFQRGSVWFVGKENFL